MVVMDKKSKKIICTDYANGKRHDFKIFQESAVRFKKTTKALTDTGFLGLQKMHANTSIAKEKKQKESVNKSR